jgi:flavin reductase (DIM6/NTAB) family NADH-FMN oxidoreductase RutF
MSRDSRRGPLEPVTSEQFRHACGRFATGVAIATVVDVNGVPHGLTVNSFSSVSLDPPLVLVCLGHAIAAIDAFRQATHFGLSILGADQVALSERFARKLDDRFDSLAWRRGEMGVPLLRGTIAAMECESRHRFEAGDHDILVGEVMRAEWNDEPPLLYFASDYRSLG